MVITASAFRIRGDITVRVVVLAFLFLGWCGSKRGNSVQWISDGGNSLKHNRCVRTPNSLFFSSRPHHHHPRSPLQLPPPYRSGPSLPRWSYRTRPTRPV